MAELECLNASMLNTAVFELVQQFYHATEIGSVVDAVSTCPAQSYSRQNKDNCFGLSELSRNTTLNMCSERKYAKSGEMVS